MRRRGVDPKGHERPQDQEAQEPIGMSYIKHLLISLEFNLATLNKHFTGLPLSGVPQEVQAQHVASEASRRQVGVSTMMSPCNSNLFTGNRISSLTMTQFWLIQTLKKPGL